MNHTMMRNTLAAGVGLSLTLALTLGSTRAQTQPLGAEAALTTMGTAFTYQGRLTSSGAPVNGACDFQFELYDAASGGTQIGSTQTKTNVSVGAGYFTIPDLDFGSGAFNGDARWLAIAVRCPAGSGSYTALSPRQALTPAPYALYAKNAPWSGLIGVPAGFADNVDDTGWSLSGNSGTTAGANFIGTTDNQALEFKVNNARVLRLEPNATSPNLIGGYSGNSVTAGVMGATISGGGESGNTNRVTDNYGSVGGGANNQAGNGGTNLTDAHYATVGGGLQNTASNSAATVGGGYNNTASGADATVGGGNSNQASGNLATVGGGQFNTVSGIAATVAGGYQNIAGSGIAATVAGGQQNIASGDRATVGGGYNNTASGYIATVGGGENNTASGDRATVGGGFQNIASSFNATVGGGYQNIASGNAATVGGGANNTAAGDYSFVVGRRAKNTDPNHDGVFLFADSTDADFSSTTANEFAARASGGFRFVSSGGTCTTTGGGWSCTSDRNAKTDFAAVNPREVLAKLATLPIETWSFKGEPGVQHMGPMAQDFYAAFGLGNSDKAISTIDLDGVALAAIQGLYQVVQEKDAQISTLQSQNAKLEARLAALERGAGVARSSAFDLNVLGIVLLGVLGGGAWLVRQRKGGRR